ncbi:EAL domain-containing protein [Belnapia sp. T6]|uniref:EAL domain-containing protein n=1 Tax=Belnapia mucosa TaxID=2804532 RepID=A0ABS1UXT5_9PROT|nr:EAL domain-containing protein [Belnapia mucosa]MBL6454205.1 EAL domain-containing protein [Belnapia mucosa]
MELSASLENATRPPPAAMRRAQRIGFLVVILFLAAAAAYTSVLILQRQQSLRAISRYNTTWLISQGMLEVARLQTAIAAFRLEPDDDSLDNVQLWLDIVANRAQLFGGGDVGPFIRDDPDREATVAQLRRAIASAQPMLERLREPGVADRMFNTFAELNSRLTRLSAASYTHGNELLSTDIQHLRQLHWVFSGVLLALLFCCFGLIATLMGHNRMVRAAHAEVNALVGDLTRTGRQLAAAKEQAQEAMAEVQEQYRALRLRDAALNQQNARFDAALNNMSQGLCMVGADRHLIVCNARFAELFGLAEAPAPGTSFEALVEHMLAARRVDGNLILALRQAQEALLAEGRAGTFFREGPNGRTIAVAHQPMGDGGWVATFEDISERRRVEARISHMAHHDELTGLPNRLLFRERMEEALAVGRGRGEELALLFLDLDHFKNVNDTLGHPVGDALLREVARRLRGCLREGELVARLGGDEFAILQTCARQPEQARRLAQQLVDVICAPYEPLGYRAEVGVSIGIALASGLEAGDAASAADQMLKNVDMALYRAKAAGRRTWRFFEASMEAELQARLALEADLREALPRNQLELAYQPIFGLKTNRLTGFEALLRWRHPTRGMVSPAIFIPVMEEMGLIEEVGRWVLDVATREAASWPAPLKVAVNLSPLQFRATDMAGSLLHVLRQSGLAPHRLELEVTESALLQAEGVAEVLQAFRGAGIRISLDDFGTRYSSLSYLRNFHFDKIKIDQSFVREMAERQDCLAIVRSVSHLADQLGMATTAEGVETAEQLRQVREAGCTEAQGYFFGPAESSADLRRWFAEPAPSAGFLLPAL